MTAVQPTSERMQLLQARSKEALGSAKRLTQYCQLPDENSRDTEKDIWNLSR